MIVAGENSKYLPYISRLHNTISLNWHINYECNFACEYCNQVKNRSNFKPFDCDQFNRVFSETDLSFSVHMSGGEPFLYPDFIQICKIITQKHWVSINTNLSTENVYEFADIINNSKIVFVNCGVHILQREIGSRRMSDFIKKIIYLQEKNIKVYANYVTYPPLIHRMQKDFVFLRKEGIQNIQAQIFQGYYRGKEYPKSFSEDDKRLIKELGCDRDQILILDKNRSFFRKYCNAGRRSFYMDAKGNLYRCLQSHRKYGNLFDETFSIDSEARLCPFKECDCPFEAILNVTDRATMTKNIFIGHSEIIFKLTDILSKCFRDPAYICGRMYHKLYRRGL